jgi:tetratricopeptide (TPR) repeat protein
MTLQGGSAMSRTLSLADSLLAMGRNFQELGRPHDALDILDRLAGFRSLPAAVAEETQARLAEIRLGRGDFTRARRHLTAALTHQPDNARYHYLMASALAGDEKKGDPHRAADHYRRSLRIDPEQPACLCEFGLLALRLGQTDEGLACLRMAVELAPDDPEPLARLVEGLCREDGADEARRVLRAALFRNPRHAGFRKLWTDFQFTQLYHEQTARRAERSAEPGATDGPTLLPFVRPAPGTVWARSRGQRVRRDGPSASEPHLPGGARRPGQRHAQ